MVQDELSYKLSVIRAIPHKNHDLAALRRELADKFLDCCLLGFQGVNQQVRVELREQAVLSHVILLLHQL